MGKRKVYHELAAIPPEAMSTEQLHTCLWDIASGTSCFGHLDEWERWFRYLLPELICRSHQRYAFDLLLERVITAFMEVFWSGIHEEYIGFRQDVSDALSLVLMRPELWTPDPSEPGDPLMSVPVFLTEIDLGEEMLHGWDLTEAPGSLAAALCFGLKYLPPADIGSWAASLLEIRNARWRAALLVWVTGASGLLREQVPRPKTLNASRPRIEWQDSHILGVEDEPEVAAGNQFNDPTQFLPWENTSAFLAEMGRRLTPGILRKWEEEFWFDPVLAAQKGLEELIDGASRAVAA